MLKLVEEEIRGKQAEVLPIGKKAVDFFRSRNVPAFTENYAEAASVSIGDCFSIAKQLCKAFRDGAYSEVHVAYTNFESMLSQSPAAMKLLPLEHPKATEPRHNTEILYEPSSEGVFDACLPRISSSTSFSTLLL